MDFLPCLVKTLNIIYEFSDLKEKMIPVNSLAVPTQLVF